MGFRRFIIIANDAGHCTCVPVLTYHGKMKGVTPMKHGVIYEKGKKPRLLSGEPELGFPPVQAQITQAGERLYREHRVDYSKLTTVEHSVKVFFIGHIEGKDFDVVSDAVNQCWEEKIHRHKRGKESVERESSTHPSYS
ncbi:hypothetical protein BKA56DRAFT_592357 [Ilyonectria sp. MPI-CAGE-AT-0026]|nr:hypothetical protein BKA56DRAFT_592357 [Ilyonectria sp. MPI-CAGE-AT-0026]